VNSATSITATVPAGVSYGRWRAATPGGTLISQLIFSIPMPGVIALSGLSGPAGATVTITGTDFNNVTGVTLGKVPVASYAVVSPTTITATVPAGVAYGYWRVLTDNGTAVSDVVYTVTG
jgi:hypothetical protein